MKTAPLYYLRIPSNSEGAYGLVLRKKRRTCRPRHSGRAFATERHRRAGELDGDDVLLASTKATASAEAEQPQITRSAISPQLQTASDLETYYLTLDAASKRRVVVQAPAAVTAAELKRIQDWLSFQLLITEMGATEPQ